MRPIFVGLFFLLYFCRRKWEGGRTTVVVILVNRKHRNLRVRQGGRKGLYHSVK